MKDLRKKLLALTATLLLPLAANADVIEWNIDVQLLNGGVITGTYGFDADTQEFSDVMVSATGGPFPATSASLTDVLEQYSDDSALDFVPAVADLNGFEDVFMLLAAPMTNAGGIIGVTLVERYVCLDASCDSFQFLAEYDNFVGRATITSTVPEPAVLGMLGLGLLAIGINRRRRKI